MKYACYLSIVNYAMALSLHITRFHAAIALYMHTLLCVTVLCYIIDLHVKQLYIIILILHLSRSVRA